ncbi:MAG TPA: response regulator [Polyangiales bacterium]|nr:response regulator [Polyangiales bacterium]
MPERSGLHPSNDVRPSILVLEDDSSHVAAMARALEPCAERYRLRYASTLAEGRLAVAAELPILVLCDLNLADGKAFDLLPGPHQRAEFPLLVLTSHGDERTAVQSIRSGAIDYVVKSREAFVELPRTIERALREWRLIEERSRAEYALRESEERFRVLFAAAPDALLIHDLTGRVLDANRASEELFGSSRSELQRLSWHELGFQGDDPRAQAVRLERQRNGRPTEPEALHMTRGDGTRVDLELRTVPIQLLGQVVVLATAQDVSLRQRAEQARHKLEEQLHHALKMEAIGRLAGGVAHDFNNMLTAISGYADLLLRNEDPGSPRATGLSEILNASRRASGLTNQLLAFSRKQIIAPVVLDLNELLHKVTRMIERLIGEDIELAWKPGSDLTYVKVDPNQIEQVVINLAINARDAMPRGGRLSVQTRNQVLTEGGLLHIDAHAGEYVVLSVEDDGCGMSSETLGRLFEPFFTTKERGRGTGLGLSIIYGVVKQNGGFIVVHSELGRGSRFEIFLPRSAGLPANPDDAQRREAPGGTETVLLVEDDPAVCDVAARFLRNCGYEVIVAMHGAEAIELVRGGRQVDLLVSDVILPAMNGRQLFEQLRSLQPRLSVVFMSGYTDDVIAPHGVLEPGTSFVEKPFSQDTLARKAREALDRAAIS